jgi:hypothetical protein
MEYIIIPVTTNIFSKVKLKLLPFDHRSRGSSVSIVSDYGLDDRLIGVRSPAGAKNFSSVLCVQTGSEAHPASCIMGTGGTFPGAKRGRGVTLTIHPIYFRGQKWVGALAPLPPSASVACSGTALLFYFAVWPRQSLFNRI